MFGSFPHPGTSSRRSRKWLAAAILRRADRDSKFRIYVGDSGNPGWTAQGLVMVDDADVLLIAKSGMIFHPFHSEGAVSEDLRIETLG